MIDKKIIQNFYTIIDYSKLNVLNFRVYFKVSYINDTKFKSLLDHLKKDPHTSWVTTCGGRYDLIATFFATNPSQFNKALREIMEKFPEQLQNYSVLTTIVNREFGRKYLFRDSSVLKQVIVGGDREPEPIDNTDMQILHMLAEDARRNSVSISTKINLTPKAIIGRIKQLYKRKIIRSFKPLIDLEKIGYTSNLLLIRYHNVSVKLENELIEYLKFHPNVTSIVKTLGEWDIEIKIDTKDTTEFRKVEREIRQKFSLLIQQIESINLETTQKHNYFPKFLIS